MSISPLLLVFILAFAAFSLGQGTPQWERCAARSSTTRSSPQPKKNIDDYKKLTEQERLEEAKKYLRKIRQQPFTVSATETNSDEPDDEVIHAECTTVKVPLRWDVPEDNRLIDFFVKRYLTPYPNTKKGALWMLQGGPGLPGDAWDSFAAILMQETNYEYDIYAPDHRGTGRSSRLSCMLEEYSSHTYLQTPELLEDCMKDLSNQYNKYGLHGFSTTNAAKDVLHVIHHTKQNGEVAAVMGVSYGVFWLNRILQLDPSVVDAAIADSVVNPTEYDFFSWEPHFEEVGKSFVETCDSDPECSAKFVGAEQGGSAHAAVAKAMERQAGINPCHPMLKPEVLRSFFKMTITSFDRTLILPIIYRINRCSHGDFKVLENMALLFGSDEEPPSSALDTNQVNPRLSASLQRNIICSEIVSRPADEDRIMHDLQAIPPFFSGGKDSNSLNVFRQCVAAEPYSYNDALSYKFSNYTGPLLTMQGTLDPQTPFSQAISWKNHFNAINPNHQFLEFTNSFHSVLSTSLTKDLSSTCGLYYIGLFLTNGFNATELDDDCIANNMRDSPTIEYFRRSDIVGFLLLGVTDLWEEQLTLSRKDLASIAVAIVILIVVLCILCVCLAVFLFILILVIAIKKLSKTSIRNHDRHFFDPSYPSQQQTVVYFNQQNQGGNSTHQVQLSQEQPVTYPPQDYRPHYPQGSHEMHEKSQAPSVQPMYPSTEAEA